MSDNCTRGSIVSVFYAKELEQIKNKIYAFCTDSSYKLILRSAFTASLHKFENILQGWLMTCIVKPSWCELVMDISQGLPFQCIHAIIPGVLSAIDRKAEGVDVLLVESHWPQSICKGTLWDECHMCSLLSASAVVEIRCADHAVAEQVQLIVLVHSSQLFWMLFVSSLEKEGSVKSSDVACQSTVSVDL